MGVAPKIKSLDHVGLTVKDLDYSVSWYERVLGLKSLRVKEWGPYPVFMLTENKSGFALFPSKNGNPLPPDTRTPHFAFQVDRETFMEFQQHFKALGVGFNFQDHTVDHSIYFRDPDNYLLEITVHL